MASEQRSVVLPSVLVLAVAQNFVDRAPEPGRLTSKSLAELSSLPSERQCLRVAMHSRWSSPQRMASRSRELWFVVARTGQFVLVAEEWGVRCFLGTPEASQLVGPMAAGSVLPPVPEQPVEQQLAVLVLTRLRTLP